MQHHPYLLGSWSCCVLQGEFAAREDAAKELSVMNERLQGNMQLQEEERAVLVRRQEHLMRAVDQHSTQVCCPCYLITTLSYLMIAVCITDIHISTTCTIST